MEKSVTRKTLNKNLGSGFWLPVSEFSDHNVLVRVTRDSRGCRAARTGDIIKVIIMLTRAEIEAEARARNDAAAARIAAYNAARAALTIKES